MKLYASQDSSAIAVGIEDLISHINAEARVRGFTIEWVRTGSRGMHWLEPMIEVERNGSRVGYGPLDAEEIGDTFFEGGEHEKCIGDVDQFPWLARQKRIVFERCGNTEPLCLEAYSSAGGWKGYQIAKEIGAPAVLNAVLESGLRGRGGGGFPTGIKWKTAADAASTQKYVVCNADEGDSGTFADRMLLEGDPYCLIEGMKIAAFVIGAKSGFVYLRSEYPRAVVALDAALQRSRTAGHLGQDFDIELRVGAGSYVCGEETALLESLEGKRGQVRPKPPVPALSGLLSSPTVVNNVLTLASVPWILRNGGAAFQALGTNKSRGTMPIQLAGNLKRTGLFEVPFGMTLGELIYEVGGGSASGRPIKAVQCGGPLGAYFPEKLFDTVYDYESFALRDGLIGHGGIVAFDDSVDMLAQARFALEFCSVESCGKCTPCRIGSVKGIGVLDRVRRNEGVESNLALIRELCETLKFGSLCALGGFTPYPVLSALNHFPDDFGGPGFFVESNS